MDARRGCRSGWMMIALVAVLVADVASAQPHVAASGNCGGRDRVEANRSGARREYRIVLFTCYGGCRAIRLQEHWVRLPPQPEGWTVAFTSHVIERRQ
jgi:hypothetical protein